MRDDSLRAACFASLGRLELEFGPDVPYRGGLDRGFQYGGRRIPYLTPYKGIFRAREQSGRAALSITTSVDSPYRDRATSDGWIYSYRAGDTGQPDNRALRAAYELQAPLVYFQGTRPGYYKPLYPWFVDADDPVEREVHVTPGHAIPLPEGVGAVSLDDPIERQYVFRETRHRLHQARFRGLVLPAYGEKCAVCRLKETQLLDAAHIVGDLEEEGEAVVSNGLSLCTIHHRAYDQHLVGIDPSYRVHVSRRLLEEDDGPMLDVLKGFHHVPIELPRRQRSRPDRERLAVRFARFTEAA